VRSRFRNAGREADWGCRGHQSRRIIKRAIGLKQHHMRVRACTSVWGGRAGDSAHSKANFKTRHGSRLRLVGEKKDDRVPVFGK